MSDKRPELLRSRRGFLYSVTAGAAVVASAAEAHSALTPVPFSEEPRAGNIGSTLYTKIVPLDGTDWLIAIDPNNQGREQKWFMSPKQDTVPIKVPWVIQGPFPDYHGVAWYWRKFVAPVNPHPKGHSYLLRFHSVDYLAEVWINGIRVGGHEGGEEPFVLDATAAIKPEGDNWLAVRVLNPTREPIDGVVLKEVAEGRRDYPVPRDNSYNSGGIVGSVELLVTPALRVEDLHVIPDYKTGFVQVRVSVQNSAGKAVRGRVHLAVAPAVAGESVDASTYDRDFPPGTELFETSLRVNNHRLWELDDPFLYRVTARVEATGTNSADERSVRCGFRDFRFEDGYFRFNGRRIRLHGALYTTLPYPVAQIIPHDESLLRRDFLNMKAMGWNIVVIHCGPALERQLDLLDELGMLVYEEHYGVLRLAESPHVQERWDHSIGGIVRRDRNHPSVVIWGMFDEEVDRPLFRHAVMSLPLIRDLDETRVVILNSGRFDRDFNIGGLSNPGSRKWENVLRDVHAFPLFPHSTDTIHCMRNSNLGEMPGTMLGGNPKLPILLTQYGVCGAQDYLRFMRNFEQIGEEHAADAQLFREKLDRFLIDWEKWDLKQCWARPEDYFAESQRNQAKLALDDYNVWVSNPALIGDVTATQVSDAWFHGCGLTNYFRELKPGMADAYNDMAARIRWCLFAEPVNVYRGSKVRLEAVLTHDDALKPGKYPIRLQVVGPKTQVLDRVAEIEIPEPGNGPEPPFAQLIHSEELNIDGPSGKYRFLATFERGAAAGGGEAEFYLDEASGMPAVTSEIVLWGEDEELGSWLTKQGLRVRPFAVTSRREVILVSGKPPSGDGPRAFAELARHLASGSNVVFLTYSTLLDSVTNEKVGGSWQRQPRLPLRWAPFPQGAKPWLADVPTWYFRADHWAKDHPIFEGLPHGGIMDYTFYREILNCWVFTGLQPPLDAVSGALDTSEGYQSDLLVSIHSLGEGRFILNSLKIRENLGHVPAAERLLRNMLNYAARDTDKPLANLPVDFDATLSSLGFN